VISDSDSGDILLNSTDPVPRILNRSPKNLTGNHRTDPNLLYDQKNHIEQAQIIWQSEVDNFTKEKISQDDFKHTLVLVSLVDYSVS
jgi:hypothetical protein